MFFNYLIEIWLYRWKSCQEKMFPLLRLLAGKFEKIWTAFPLTTFLGKKFKMASLEISLQKIIWTSPVQKNWKKKHPLISYSLKKKTNEIFNMVHDSRNHIFSRPYLSEIISFFKFFCTRWCFGLKTFFHTSRCIRTS